VTNGKQTLANSKYGGQCSLRKAWGCLWTEGRKDAGMAGVLGELELEEFLVSLKKGA
jgi:hypothetical protein